MQNEIIKLKLKNIKYEFKNDKEQYIKAYNIIIQSIPNLPKEKRKEFEKLLINIKSK
jgi:thermostable 8-oxoguanine DNA glycosylase